MYKTNASRSIEARERRSRRGAGSLLSPCPALASLTGANHTTIELILITLQTRILGFAKARARLAKVSTALGNPQNPRKTVNKELRGLAHVSKDGWLRLEEGIENEIKAIASELGLTKLHHPIQPTRIYFPPPKPSHSDDPAQQPTDSDSDGAIAANTADTAASAPSDSEADSDYHFPFEEQPSATADSHSHSLPDSMPPTPDDAQYSTVFILRRSPRSPRDTQCRRGLTTAQFFPKFSGTGD